MAKRTNRKIGDRIDAWTLAKYLGGGGNAEVWEAVRDDGVTTALKLLYQSNPESEPYRRFRAEVQVLKALRHHSGILPLVDFHLPARLSRTEPAWLALPLAIPVRKALGVDPALNEVVEVVQAFASTLEELEARYQIYHRDLKPENLYKFKNRWCLGDFGLVDYPDKEGLTAPGRWIGPIFYLAPELLADPDHAESGPADVYSLSKTLWVLATGQNYPLAGFLTRQVNQFRISTYNKNERAFLLDSLVERATHPDPRERPKMKEISEELAAWLRHPVSDSYELDLSELQARVNPIIQIHVQAASIQESCIRYVDELHKLFVKGLRPLVEALGRVTGLKAEMTNQAGIINLPEIYELSKVPHSLSNGICSFGVESPTRIGGGNNFLGLVGGFVVHYTKIGDLFISAGYVVALGAGNVKKVWCATHQAKPESARAEEVVSILLTGLNENFSRAVTAFAEELNSRGPI